MAIAISSGLHSNSAIWTGGVVPVAPELAVIPVGVVVTQDGAWDVGDGVNSLSITGELINNDLITYRGNINLYGIMTRMPGSRLTATAGNWQITQYTGSVLRSVPGPVKPIFDADVGNYFTWRDSASTDAVTIDFDGMEFYRCGSSSVAGVLQRGKNTSALNIQMRNILWHTCGQMRLGFGVTHHPGAICQLDSVVVVNPQHSNIISYAASFPPNWVAGSRYLRDIYIAGPLTGGTAVVLVDRKNARSNPEFEVSIACAIDARVRLFDGGFVSVSGAIMFDQYAGSSSEITHRLNGETFYDRDVMIYASRNNARVYDLRFTSSPAVPVVVSNALIEFDSAASGGRVLQHKDGAELINSLIINGNPFYSTYASTSGISRYQHNTHVILSDAIDGAASMMQYDNAITSPAQDYGLSNIRVDLRAVPTTDFANVQPSGTPDQVTSLDYNNHWTPAVASPFNPYPTVVITGLIHGDAGFGGNDQFVDPRFQFAPRSLKDFDALHGGPGTAINLWQGLFKHSGYDVNGNSATANPAVTRQAAMDWVRAAYIPTNPALQGAAHDGGDIGAFDVLSEYVVTVSDVAGAADGLAPSASMAVVDAATGNDVVLSVVVALSVMDLGAGVDLQGVEVFAPVADAATGIDALPVVSVNLSVTDNGNTVDLVNALNEIIKTVSDAANGFDAVSVVVALNVIDVADGADWIGDVDVFISVIEQAGGVDVAVKYDSVTRIASIKFRFDGRSVSLVMH